MEFEKFRQNTRNVKRIQNTRIAIGNGIFGTTVEALLKESPHLKQISAMRRDKKADRKKTAGLIKKALVELGMTPETLTEAFEEAKKEDLFHTELSKMERIGLKDFLKPDLERMPIYKNFLSRIKGLGALTSAELLTIVGDITRFNMPSKLCEYFGVGDIQKLVHNQEANFNPKSRALLLGVIGDNFLKRNSQYRIIYDQRAERTKKLHPEIWHLNPDGTKATCRNMHPKHGYLDAKRVMMKRFLIEFWAASYQAKGMKPPTKPYALTLPNHHAEPMIVEYGETNHNISENQINSVKRHTQHRKQKRKVTA